MGAHRAKDSKMSYIRKIAKFITLPIWNKEKRKQAREQVENFIHKVLNTEYYQCHQIFNQIYQENRAIGFDKYHLISLGYNCFGRMTFNFWGLKPRKADGEKTMPFDISVHDLPVVVKLLQTHFKDYFQVEYDEKEKFWRHSKYKISFVHDHEENIEVFKERYTNRIKALDETISDKTPCLFFAYYEGEVKATDINALYEVLCKICAHKKFKLVYMVFNHQLPEGINKEIAVYSDNYPEGYVHMDKFTKFKKNGLRFERGVVEFTRHQIEELIK